MLATHHNGYNQYLRDLPTCLFDNDTTVDMPEWFFDEIVKLRMTYEAGLIPSRILIPQLDGLKKRYFTWLSDEKFKRNTHEWMNEDKRAKQQS